MSEIRKLIEHHLNLVVNLMEYLESNDPRDSVVIKIAKEKLVVLKTSLEKHIDTHEVFIEALFHLRIDLESHPELSQWHRKLSAVQGELSWWLVHLNQFDQ